jgi:hypothetical protein
MGQTRHRDLQALVRVLVSAYGLGAVLTKLSMRRHPGEERPAFNRN